MRFEEGKTYFAVPCLEGAPKALVTMVGRKGRTILFTATQPMATTWVDEFDGREVARLRDSEGAEFTVSPASIVDVQLVHDVTLALTPRVARRGFFCKLRRGIC